MANDSLANCTCETRSVLVNATIHGDPDNVTSEIWCPVYNDCCNIYLNGLAYWLEGVIQVTFGIIGILMNIGSSLILGSKEMRNPFNLLLIALCLFDCGYLFGAILESFRKSFKLATFIHIYLFPYLLYPCQMIMMSASIFMTVAIAMERYVAVHYPIDYNQAMTDEHANVIRLLKYVGPVFTFAILFNIPKFFEATVKFNEKSEDPDKPHLAVTDFRLNPDYAIYYNNWTRLAILGIIPAVLLIFFNAKIYQDIRARKARRRPQNPQPTPSRFTTNGGGNTTQQTTMIVSQTKESSVDTRAATSQANRVNEDTTPAVDASEPFLKVPTAAEHRSSLSMPRVLSKLRPKKKVSSPTPDNRRQKEDNLAVIFMGIVIVFLVCHFPRIFLSLHEMLVIRNTMACSKVGYYSFPLWALVFAQFSHILLVLNSSMNSVIYCMVSSKYRAQALKYLLAIKTKLCHVYGILRSGCVWCQSHCRMPENGNQENNVNNNTEATNRGFEGGRSCNSVVNNKASFNEENKTIQSTKHEDAIELSTIPAVSNTSDDP